MTDTQRARLQARLVDYVAKRDALSVALDSAIENAEIQTYSFTDPEGGQSATRRDPEKITKLIAYYDQQIEYIDRLLGDGGGLVSVNMRRFP